MLFLYIALLSLKKIHSCQTKCPTGVHISILRPHGLVLQLQGKAVCNQGNELTIGGFALGVGDRVFPAFSELFNKKTKKFIGLFIGLNTPDLLSQFLYITFELFCTLQFFEVCI